MWNSWKALLMLVLFSSTSMAAVAAEEEAGCGILDALPYMAAGVGAVAAAPVLLAAAGSTKAGIAAGSLGAKLMSWTAVANGGGVPAGGLVATLQALGAKAGFSYGAAGAAGAAGASVHQFVCGKKNKDKK